MGLECTTARTHAPVPVLDIAFGGTWALNRPAHGLLSELELKSLILENSVDGFIAHSLDGRLVYFNETAAAQLGYSRKEFAALDPYGWVGDDSLPFVPSRLALIREKGSLLFASRAAPRDGSEMHTEVHSRLVRTTGGEDLVISVIRDVTERVIAHERIRHLAFHDRLTGLANRMKLEDDLRTSLASADRHDDLVGVVYLDLDDFKPVNDELGHAVGDEVLRVVAERLMSCVRECDTVARLGGDEFLVLVTRVGTRNDLAVVARKLEECIKLPIPVDGGHIVRVTTSAGLATYEPGEAAEDLMNRADHAMYRAKEAGLPGWQAFLNGE
jgi:diguanylate cyclase (GGDEF)-like protein/PAS domain S-box-containing protein